MQCFVCYIARARFTVWAMGDIILTYIIIRSTASYSATHETTTSVGLAHTRPITEAVIYKAHYTRIWKKISWWYKLKVVHGEYVLAEKERLY